MHDDHTNDEMSSDEIAFDPMREQVEIAKSLLGECRRTRWVRKDVSPSASTLSDLMINYNYLGRISTGAIIIAASELGIVWVPDGGHDALIGVNVDDVRARTMP